MVYVETQEEKILFEYEDIHGNYKIWLAKLLIYIVIICFEVTGNQIPKEVFC